MRKGFQNRNSYIIKESKYIRTATKHPKPEQAALQEAGPLTEITQTGAETKEIRQRYPPANN